MAFNPFHRFRKHQKVFFAILTIVCMFVFILSFGPGDVLTRGLFASFRNRGPYVATLYGRSIYESADLGKTLALRQMANDFVIYTVQMGQSLTAMEDGPILQKIKIPEVEQAQTARMIRRNPQFLQGEFAQQFLFPAIRRDIMSLSRLLASGRLENAEDKKAVSNFLNSLYFEAWLFDPKRNRRDFYFGGTPATDDLLDFLIWKHQADRLGITLGEPDVLAALREEAGNPKAIAGKSFAADPTVNAFLHNTPKWRAYDASDLLKAIGDEFRVVLAQEALLGLEPGSRAYRNLAEGVVQSPGVPTPDEYLKVFRHYRTTLRVAMLPVAVDHFVSEVKGEPSPKDLVRLYDKFKDQEPSPSRAFPGFAIPRKVSVQYLSARADLPSFKARARALALQPGLLPITVAPSGFAPGGGPLAGLLSLGVPLVQDPLAKDYDRYVETAKNEPWLPPQGFRFATDYKFIHDTDLFRTGPLAFFTGHLLGSIGLPGGLTVLPAVSGGLAGTIALYSRPEEQRVLSSYVALLAQAPIAQFGAPGVLTPLTFVPYAPPVAEQSLVESTLVQKMESRLAPDLMREALDNFREELTKVKSHKDKAAQLVADTVKKYGLESRLHTMKEPRDRYGLDTDPAMQFMKTAFLKSYQTNPRPPDFAPMFFAGVGVYDPRPWAANFRDQRSFSSWSFDEEPFLYWRIEDIAGRPPKSLDEVRDQQVMAAWRFQEARVLARKAAQEIQEQLKEKKDRQTPAEAVKFLREQKLGEVFELDGVARLVVPKEAVPTLSREYRPFVVPADKIAFPRDKFVDKLLDELKKPGDSLVIADQPEAHFYVTVLLERVVPSRREFLEVYSIPPGTSYFWNNVLMEEVRAAYRHRFLSQMRSDASGGRIDENGRLILAIDVKNNVDTSGDQGE